MDHRRELLSLGAQRKWSLCVGYSHATYCYFEMIIVWNRLKLNLLLILSKMYLDIFMSLRNHIHTRFLFILKEYILTNSKPLDHRRELLSLGAQRKWSLCVGYSHATYCYFEMIIVWNRLKLNLLLILSKMYLDIFNHTRVTQWAQERWINL